MKDSTDMKTNGKDVNTQAANMPEFTPFWPMFLISVSLTALLGWQLYLTVKQYNESNRFGDRLSVRIEQAAEVEARFQAMMMELLKLSETDPAAEVIITKYGVKYNPPAPQPGMTGTINATLPGQSQQ
jgi:hypothetical protein